MQVNQNQARLVTLTNATKNNSTYKITAYDQTITFYIDYSNDRAYLSGLNSGDQMMTVQEAREFWQQLSF